MNTIFVWIGILPFLCFYLLWIHIGCKIKCRIYEKNSLDDFKKFLKYFSEWCKWANWSIIREVIKVTSFMANVVLMHQEKFQLWRNNLKQSLMALLCLNNDVLVYSREYRHIPLRTCSSFFSQLKVPHSHQLQLENFFSLLRYIFEPELVLDATLVKLLLNWFEASGLPEKSIPSLT